jgi:uncharacterized protein (DUF927 family)
MEFAMSKKAKPLKRLGPASRVKIVGEGFDEWNNRYFKFAVIGSDVDLPPFSVEQITDKSSLLWTALNNAGANLFTHASRTEFLKNLQARPPEEPSFRVATRVGWNGRVFVLPNRVIGKPTTRLETAFRDLDQQMLAKYRTRGTLAEWKEKIGVPCRGNPILMFAVSLAFTGPILPLVKGPRSGGFQLSGDPETGKTTAEMLTGSIWGCHRSPGRRERGFVESWNTTSGKVEITALAHNHTVLLFDETKRAGRTDKERGEVVSDVAFGLAEQTEKERLTNQGSGRAWELYFFSTSNLSLEKLADAAGITIDDADRGRMVDIFVPKDGRGVYRDLHDFADGEAFTDTLKIRCRKFFGVPGNKFVRKLVDARNRDVNGLKRHLEEERQTYRTKIDSTAKAKGLKLLKRASGRYATVFAAGSLAIDYGILPWKREKLLRAILACQLNALRKAKEPGAKADGSVAGLRGKLIDYMRLQRNKFVNLDLHPLKSTSHKFGSALGYAATHKGKGWLYLTPDGLKAIIGTGRNADLLKQELVAEGLLAPGKKGRLVVQRRIFADLKGNKAWRWVHAFDATIV